MRTYNIEKIVQAVSQYDEQIEGFYPEEWLDNSKNIALINEKGDVALFENQNSLVNSVCGHYFFFSRGKEAVKVAENFLDEIFSDEYLVELIIGLTPVEHKGAIWLNKRLGFKEHGEVDTVIGPCKFVLLTKQEWKDSHK